MSDGIREEINEKEKETGIYSKFNVSRTDGSSAPGGKHHDCPYFVIDLKHDKFAISALRSYADACYNEYPELAEDIYKIIYNLKNGKEPYDEIL